MTPPQIFRFLGTKPVQPLLNPGQIAEDSIGWSGAEDTAPILTRADTGGLTMLGANVPQARLGRKPNRTRKLGGGR